jgi:hypothetical protein
LSPNKNFPFLSRPFIGAPFFLPLVINNVGRKTYT